MDDFGLDLRHRMFDTGEVRLHIVEAGPASGRPVLLLHGFPEFWYGWRAQISPLAAAGYRVIVPDQRGYNRSDKPREVEAYSMKHLVADMIAIIGEIGRPIDVIGHDWGAAVAWHLAMRSAQRVRKLAVLNVPHPAAMSAALRSGWRQRLRSWYILFFQIPWLPERVLGLNRAAGLAFLLKGSGKAGSFSVQDLERYREAWLQPGAVRGMLGWYRAALRFAGDTLLEQRVEVPTLVLWGERDAALESDMARISVEWCDDAKLVMFPSASHWVQHDEAQAVNRYLLEFIA